MEILKLQIPDKTGVNGRKPYQVSDILPYLPKEDCFFDSRHWVVGVGGVIPFSITTRIRGSLNQFLKRYMKIRQATGEGTIEVKPGGLFDSSFPTSETRRGRVQGEGMICPTLTATSSQNILKYLEDEGGLYRFRSLTERECFRLQGVPEEYIDRIQGAGISGCQQYKLAGNSICVDALVGIFHNLINGCEKPPDKLF